MKTTELFIGSTDLETIKINKMKDKSEEKLFILDLLRLNRCVTEKLYPEESVINIIKQVLMATSSPQKQQEKDCVNCPANQFYLANTEKIMNEQESKEDDVVFTDDIAIDAIVDEVVDLVNKQYASQSNGYPEELQQLMDDIAKWSDKTFGEGQRNPAIVYHLKKEVEELIEAFNPNTRNAHRKLWFEFADCMMLLLDSAHHVGFSAKDLINASREKLNINKDRKWGNPDKNGVVEHIG